jgi:hypothetical protein
MTFKEDLEKWVWKVQIVSGTRDLIVTLPVIIGIDYTKSNNWTGSKTFGGKCLHDLSPFQMNPYQQAIHTIGQVFPPCSSTFSNSPSLT